tara:strand:- start:645 stop:929 length:285 start_codon:yes stop_codon:yes gene_type:complete
MKLDKELLQKIAANARLELTDKEIKEFLPQLQEVLELFSKLDKVDTKNVKPSFQPIPLADVMREDKVTSCLTHEEVFLNVENKQDDYFKGPKAI